MSGHRHGGVHCALAAILLAGCGTPVETVTREPDQRGAENQKGSFVKRVPASRLAWDQADVKPKMDGGRVDITPPQGWQIAPYDPDYLISFYQGPRLPRILVTAQFSPDDQVETVTEENLLAFARAMRAELEAAETSFLEPVLPMIIGDRPCIRYVTGAHFRTVMVERQFVVTHVNGRRYTVELQVEKGDILRYRDAGYAVLAGMKFTDIRTEKGGPAEAADEQPSENEDQGAEPEKGPVPPKRDEGGKPKES